MQQEEKFQDDHKKRLLSTHHKADFILLPFSKLQPHFQALLNTDYETLCSELKYLTKYFECADDFVYEDNIADIFQVIQILLQSNLDLNCLDLVHELIIEIIRCAHKVRCSREIIDYIMETGFFDFVFTNRSIVPMLDLLGFLIFRSYRITEYCYDNGLLNDLIENFKNSQDPLILKTSLLVYRALAEGLLPDEDEDDNQNINYWDIFLPVFQIICSFPIKFDAADEDQLYLIKSSLFVIGQLGKSSTKYSVMFFQTENLVQWIRSLDLRIYEQERVFYKLMECFISLFENVEASEERIDDPGSLIDMQIPIELRTTLCEKIIQFYFTLEYFNSESANISIPLELIGPLISKNIIANNVVQQLNFHEMLITIYQNHDLDYQARISLIKAYCSIVQHVSDELLPELVEKGFFELIEDNIESMIKDIPFQIVDALSTVELFTEKNAEYKDYFYLIFDNPVIIESLQSILDDHSYRNGRLDYELTPHHLAIALLSRSNGYVGDAGEAIPQGA